MHAKHAIDDLINLSGRNCGLTSLLPIKRRSSRRSLVSQQMIDMLDARVSPSIGKGLEKGMQDLCSDPSIAGVNQRSTRDGQEVRTLRVCVARDERRGAAFPDASHLLGQKRSGSDFDSGYKRRVCSHRMHQRIRYDGGNRASSPRSMKSWMWIHSGLLSRIRAMILRSVSK